MVTILKETLKKIPGMYILYRISIDVQVYLLQGVIKNKGKGRVNLSVTEGGPGQKINK